MKRTLTHSLLSVSALALLATAAHAQAPSLLQPKGGWSVTKMESSSNGAGPYCALARQYDKNIIFTLGRNMTDEYSLAVDFQKAQMDPEKAYKLTLSPGAGQQRAFNLLPLSERAMVIRLGWDESFFKALDTSRTLRVGIGDVDYSFNMPDIAMGQKDLQNCIDGLKENAKTAQADTAASAPGDVLNAEASGAKGFSARKGAEPVIETAEAVPAPTVVASNVTPLPASAGPVEPLPGPDGDRGLLKQVADLRAENDRLAKTIVDQRKKLEESYRNAQDSNALAEMQEKLRLLETENKRLTSGGAAGTVTAQAAAAPTPSATDTAALDDLRAQVNKVQAENAKLQTEIAALKKQEDTAAKNVAALTSAAGGASKDDLEKATRRYTEAEREVQRLAKELDAARKDDGKGKIVPAAVAAAPKEDTKAVEENKKLKDRIAALEQQVKDTNLSSTEGTKAATELAALKTRFIDAEKQRETMRAENQKLAADLKKLQSQKGDDAQARAQLTKAQADAKAAQDKVAAMEADLKKLRATVVLDNYRAPAQPMLPAQPAQDVQAAKLAATEPAAGFEPPPLQAAPKVQQASLSPNQAIAAGGKGYSEDSLKTLLGRANVPMQGGVKRMAEGVYGWKTDRLLGRAEVSPAGDFGRKVDDFINKAKSQCQGDFAAIPSAQSADAANVEMACVGKAGSTSSSVAFFETDGSFVAVAHETTGDNMELAMDARDQVARAR